jgi:hypothetical protein
LWQEVGGKQMVVKEKEKNLSASDLLHPKDVMKLASAIRKIDGFWFDGNCIKRALDGAFAQGELGIFSLDCLVSRSAASTSGIGKVPLTDKKAVLNNSGIVYQLDSLKYLFGELKDVGLKAALWVFLGDDDWVYSVSRDYSLDNPEVKKAINDQIGVLGNHLSDELSSLGVDVRVSGWLSVEQSLNLLNSRARLLKEIQETLPHGTLPTKVTKRLSQLVQQREQLLEIEDADSPGLRALAAQQAVQELTSFVLQGLYAPSAVHHKTQKTPLIFVNSYPELATQFLDDECLRLGLHLGFTGYPYGTIHLPGPERLAKFLRVGVKIAQKPMTCGDPKGNQNWKK